MTAFSGRAADLPEYSIVGASLNAYITVRQVLGGALW